MVGDVQMRHRTDPQGRSMQLPIKLQELARISGAGIGDDKADVEVVGDFRKLVEKTLLRQIRHHVAVLHVKAFREALSHFVEQTFPSRYQHYVSHPFCSVLPAQGLLCLLSYTSVN